MSSKEESFAQNPAPSANTIRGTGKFTKGVTPVGAKPWVKGQSGNPSGRPKQAPEYREQCRSAAFELLDRLSETLRTKELTVDEMLAALAELSDRGGLLSGSQLASAEAARGSIVLRLIESDKLTQEQRLKLLNDFVGHQKDALAEADVPAALPPVTDAG